MSSIYHDHVSPMHSPMISPMGSPYQNQGEWDQLHSQFSQQMSLLPPSVHTNGNSSQQQGSSMDQTEQQQSNTKGSNNSSNGNNNTFVHKLHA